MFHFTIRMIRRPSWKTSTCISARVKPSPWSARPGPGKTTLVKLLSRFYDPTEGRILVDGYDLREVTQASLRSQMGVVLQDPFLFNGTVAENIRFGRLAARPGGDRSRRQRPLGRTSSSSACARATRPPLRKGG